MGGRGSARLWLDVVIEIYTNEGFPVSMTPTPLIYPLTGLHMELSITLGAPNRRLLLQLGWPAGGEWKPMSSFLGCHMGFWWQIHRLNPHLNKEGENLASSDPSGSV